MKSDAFPEELQDIVFLGGIFLPGQIDMIRAESKGVIQNAADALQKSIIQGLSLTYSGHIQVVNLPYIGTYPVGFRKAVFPAARETIFSEVPVDGRGFIALRYVKPFARAASAFAGLQSAARKGSPIIVVYAAHMPFLWAALACRLLTPGARVCLILPDFPEYMGEGGWLYNLAKAIESRLFRFMARSIDCFVPLTATMAESMCLSEDQYVVVEGIAGAASSEAGHPPADLRVFLYSGTLAGRYGILQLLEAFRKVRNPAARLWICGEGDSRQAIEEAAKIDNRIRFLGQISRDEVTRIQRDVSVLVNPRAPVGDFVKYSFPSKTIEYMMSGRPVLMYDLPGVPDEYHPYYFRPSDNTVAGLAEAIERLAAEDAQVLDQKGSSARRFVEEHKGIVPQCRKIADLLVELQSRRAS